MADDKKLAADQKKRDEAAAKQFDKESVEADKQRERINELVDELRDALVESGESLDTANAVVHAARPNDPNMGVVGNLADLHRAGGEAHAEARAGLAAMVPEPQAVVTTSPESVPEEKK